MPTRVPLESRAGTASVLAALRDGGGHAFALEGVWAGGGAVVGARPARVARADEDPFALLDDLPPAGGAAPEGFVGGGWFGWLGYGLGRRVEPAPPPPPGRAPVPAFALAFYDHVLRRDPEGRWWLEALDDAIAEKRLAGVRARLATAAAVDPPPAVPPLAVAPGGDHVTAVADAVRRIADGELFQANLCLRLEAPWDGDPLALLEPAVRALRPAYAGVFLRPDGGVVSLSPELFLRREGARVRTGPIKGTAPAVPGAAERLRASAKDAAEHVMIVDLMRNDLGRVAEYGSVRADPAPRLEDHVGVHHLVSRVRAVVRDGAGDAELLRATFPPGSVTGAPKVQALRVIAELEGTAREAYTGALGYASPWAGLELAVTIRTFEAAGGRLWLGAGGGVVADSDPEAELAEALAKAAPLAVAIGTTVQPPPARRRPSLPRALGPGRERPDPALGVFETILVRDGIPVDLDAHLDRHAASVAALYGKTLGRNHVVERLRAVARGAGDARLRLVTAPGAPMRVELGPLPRDTGPVLLAPVLLPGGLGAHKWVDRRLLDTLTAALGGAPLIVDASGESLESAWASVLARVDGTWRTPPADGRILPGTARARLLAAGAVVEAPVTLDELRRADEIRLVSALRTVAARL